MSDLRVIGGIIHVLKRGLQWRDAPEIYGSHKTLYNQFVRWSKVGVFNKIFSELVAQSGVPDQLQIDATYLKAHRTAASLLKEGMFPALLAGTMVGVIAFAPGQTVEYTGDLFWIIMIALLFSWILAMIITPLTCYWLFPDRMKQAEDAKEGVFSIKYKQLMRWSLRSRKIVIGVVLSLFVLSIWGTQFMSQGFFPQSTKVILFVRTVFRQD